MKYTALVLFLFFSISAFGQLDQFRMVGTGSWTTQDDSTHFATVTFASDLTANSFLPTGIVDSMRVFTQTGQRYTIDSVGTKTFSSAVIYVVESGGDWGKPSGQVLVYENRGRESVPAIPFASNGATSKLQEAVVTYNSSVSTGGSSGNVTGPGTSTDNAIATFDGTANTIQSSLATVDDSGNIATSGTVDGRDISADGAKLDGIEANATDDQSPTEIRDALETLTGSNRLDISAIDRIPLRDGVINRQTGNYVLVLSDTTKVIEMNVGSANTVTVPPQSSVSWPDNTYITISQYGAGATSIVAGSGVTIRSSADTLVSPGQYAPMVLKKITADEWYLWNGTPSTASVTGEALTKTDDTNVTATLTGSPSTALVNAANIALGWTGQLSAARGGTGSTVGAWLLSGTSTLSGAATIAQATNQLNLLNGNILIGPTSSTITTNTKLDIRGLGTTTQNTIRAASSTNTEIMTLTDAGNLTLAIGAMQVPVSVGYKLSGNGWTLKSGTVGGLTGITYTATNYTAPHIFTSATLGAADTHYRGVILNSNWSPLPGTNEFTALSITPTLGRNTAGGTRTATGITYNPTINVEPDTHYGIRIVTKKAKNGFGVTAPTATAHIRADTINNNVLTYESEAVSDNPAVAILQNRIATTDATLTTLHTLAIPATTTMLIKGFVVARRTGGTSGTAEDGAGYEFTAVYKNVAGTATVINSTITVVGEDQVGWDCQLNTSSGNVLIQVQGAVDNNVTWHLSELKTMKVGS